MDYPEMVSCRMTSGDLDRLTASAQRAGMARSEYLRTSSGSRQAPPAKAPSTSSTTGPWPRCSQSSSVGAATTTRRCAPEHHRAVHPEGSPPEYGTFGQMLSEAEGKLEEVEQGRQVIEYVLADIAGSTSVSGD